MQLIKKIFIYIFFLLVSFNVETIEKEIFLSLKYNKVNVRYGPGKTYPVKYVYKKKNLPVKIIDEKENWRRIIDHQYNSGWIQLSQLKSSNSFIILEDKILFKKSTLFSKPILKLKKGRLLLIKNCKKEWCKVETDNYSGWIKNTNIWGNIK
jgi:SH3-like domain-containing protein|tara:strand:- start:1155 stop:1610 length:456 start_codon:yes stop_codon:yes gene_type:complete